MKPATAFLFTPRSLFQLFLAAVLAVGTLVGCLRLVPPETAIYGIKVFGYWFILGTVLLLVRVCWQDLRELPNVVRRHFAEHRWALLAVGLLSVFVHLHEPHQMKILGDEAVIAATAMTMHESRLVRTPTQVHVLQSDLKLMSDIPDKRPFLVPFLISTLHDLTGFRPENVFILNAIASTAVLLLIYLWGACLGGVRMGVTLALLLAGLPLFSQLATAGGLEPVNAALILIFALAGLNYLKSPGAEGLSLLILIGVLLAQARYESIIYTAAIPVLFVLKTIRERALTLNWLAVFSPLLLLPPLLVQRVFHSDKAFFQLAGSDQQPFGMEYLVENLSHAVHYLFTPSHLYPSAPFVTAVALIATLFAFLLVVKREARSDSVMVWGALATLTLVNIGVLMFYYWGKLDDPMVSRLSLPLILAGIMAVPLFLAGVFGSRPLPKWIPIICLLHLGTYTLPSNVKHEGTQRLYPSLSLDYALEQLGSRPDTELNFVYGRSSISFAAWGYATSYPESLFLDPHKVNWVLGNGMYDNVFLVQEYTIDTKTGEERETGNVALDSFFEKEILSERWIYPRLVVRFSRVLSAHPASEEALAEWKERMSVDEAYFENFVRPDYEWPEDGYETDDAYFENWSNRLP